MTTPVPGKIVELNVGDKAPDFTADLYPAGKVSLAEFKGKSNVILAFYPKDSTPGCTAEMCAFTADLTKFESAGTKVFGVSCDSISNHEKFAIAHNLKVPLISDSQTDLGKAYGAIREGYLTASRKLFIIDKDGTIQHIHDGMPDNSKLLEALGMIK